MFDSVTSIEELNRRRTELLSDPNLPDERVAEINKAFSMRRRQISLAQRGKNAVLMPFRVITDRKADPSIAVDAVFNPDAMLLTLITPLQTPFIRNRDMVSVHNQVDITFEEHGNFNVVYSCFS
jgi:hypothetical protein